MFIKIPLVVYVTLIMCAKCQNPKWEVQQDELVAEIMKGVQKFAQQPRIHQNTVPPELSKALRKIFDVDKIAVPDKSRNNVFNFKNVALCVTCGVFAQTVIVYKHAGGSRLIARNLLIFLCQAIFKFDLEFCSGVIDLNLDVFIYIFDKKPWLTSNTACGIILQTFDCHVQTPLKWRVHIPAGVAPKRPRSEVPGHKVVQITDIHYDSSYEAGRDTDCGQPVCCSKYNGPPKQGHSGSGYWGDYRPCDTPKHTVLNLLEQINRNHSDADFVYFTGDVIAHRIWNTSVQQNTEELKTIYSMFEAFLGKKKVYPIVGNHEPNPLNLYSSADVIYFNKELTSQWLFDLIAVEWMRWLPADTKHTLRRGGFYTVLHEPGFRIIGLNSNVCYVYNWWLLLNEVDPYGQLQWLADTLAEAEKNNEYVHILSHIPPGDPECLKQWSQQYRRIVTRYATTIRAQFNGHTHMGELRLFYDEGDQVVNVAYNGGSLTPYIALDPNYRVYELSEDTWDVLDFDEYVFDLEKANRAKHTRPEWFKLYSFKESFGLNSTRNEELSQLPWNMWNNRSLLMNYRKYKNRNSMKLLNVPCDEECYRTLLCEIVKVEFDDNEICDMITQN